MKTQTDINNKIIANLERILELERQLEVNKTIVVRSGNSRGVPQIAPLNGMSPLGKRKQQHNYNCKHGNTEECIECVDERRELFKTVRPKQQTIKF